MLVTALRPSELFALRWKCFDFDACLLTIKETVYRGQLRAFTKTTEQGDTDRLTVYVPQAVAVTLIEWCAQSKHNLAEDFIFGTDSGKFWWKENYQRRVLDPIAKLAGVKANFACLRRSVATHCQHLGSPKDISVMMRHKRVATAQDNYVQAIESSVREMAEKLAGKVLKGSNEVPTI